MQYHSGEAGQHNGRELARTNLLMAAVLVVDGAANPVRIRDLSPGGAQIEGAVLPPVGSLVTLVRGQLTVQGRVNWQSESRRGVQFSSHVSVADWMANSSRGAQARADHVVAAVKAGTVPLVPVAALQTAGDRTIAEDLRQVSKLLDNLGSGLADDAMVIAMHSVPLQNLDIAVQTLVALAQLLGSGATASAEATARLNDLRSSCAEALRAG